MTAETEVLDLERRRQEATVGRNRASLDTLFDESLTYVHMNGLVENRDEAINSIMTKTRFLSIERGNMRVRVVGDLAILTGPMKVHLQRPDGSEANINAVTTQVAQRRADGWRFVAFQPTQDVVSKE